MKVGEMMKYAQSAFFLLLSATVLMTFIQMPATIVGISMMHAKMMPEEIQNKFMRDVRDIEALAVASDWTPSHVQALFVSAFLPAYHFLCKSPVILFLFCMAICYVNAYYIIRPFVSTIDSILDVSDDAPKTPAKETKVN